MELTIEQALKRGVTAHKEGRLEDAERFYRAILQSQPLHPDANHNLGVLAVAVNKAEVALPLFKRAAATNPKREQFWLSYIDTLIEQQQFGTARQALTNAMNAGLVSEKLDALETELNLSADGKIPPLAQLNSLLEYYQAGEYDAAEKHAISITQAFPKHQLGWKVLGAVLQQTDRISESLASVKNAVDLVPQDAEAHNNLGITLLELGRLDEAEASFNQAIVLQSDYAEANNNLGNTLRELSRFDEAEANYMQAIALKSDYAEAINNLGMTLSELGRLEEAEASYRRAIELRSDYAEAYNNLGNILKERGSFEEAEASHRK